jgi:prophage regulatory protein
MPRMVQESGCAPRAPDRKLLRFPELIDAVGLSKSGILKLIEAGQFPNPVRIGRRAMAWRAADVERWIESRPEVTRPKANAEEVQS